MSNKINYEKIVADLVQEAINIGMDERDVIYILLYWGMTEDQITEWYGLTFPEGGK